ncbi:MAG TPA: glycoside hydrolase family 38 C-terminal domain-containing protein [Gemmatimonadales bacterium]|jgi:alpha-mannosidase|nr:glycoside hydrolase family 38 C-terminal domain-containing protein [Gemmatimonadales bacterium]
MMNPLHVALLLLLQQPQSNPSLPVAIRPWLLTTPVSTDTGATRLTRDYLGGEATAFPDSSEKWRPVTIPASGIDDLGKEFGGAKDRTVVYAFTYVYAPKDESRTLVLASDDDILAWLNGQRVHYHDVPRGVDHDRDTVEVRLAKGWNTLLLKVVNRGGDFGFGAWMVGDSIHATNRRPPDAQPGNLPASTVAAGPLRVSGPVLWSRDTLWATGSTSLTTWGKNPPSGAVVSLTTGDTRFSRDSVDSLVPGTPKVLRRPFDVATLSRVALDSSAALSTRMGNAADVRVAPLDPAAVLDLLDSRIQFASWSDHGTTLETTVTVPAPLGGLSVDLLAAEFGPTARYSVNGQSRTLGADGTVPLCAQCSAGDSLHITVGRDSTRPWWDHPRARVRDRSYSDLALDLTLLPSLGDSSGSVPWPDAHAWLAAMLSPDKAAYRALEQQGSRSLAADSARFARDTIHLVGNSHIDAAWLWRYTETMGVAEATWRTGLKLEQKFPSMTFAASAAQYYDWLANRAPGLLDSIRAAEHAGRWEAVGGWWLEADQNMPGGESLVRQGLYGQRYFEKLFGRRSKVAWTPDSFGYPWQMPQIWHGLGMDFFVTQKIRWNDSTTFPYDAFVWKGRDGTKIFAYNPWGYDHDLDGATLVQQMRQDNARTDTAHHMLVLYGVGDHGGGPTAEMLDRRGDLGRLPAFPVLKDDRPTSALTSIRGARPFNRWPVWDDELYLEYHRATYTTQSWMKRRNRESETLLSTAEFLATIDPAPYPKDSIEHAWRQTLFNQFHDLLPGSGIHPIYVDAMATYDSVAAAGTAIRDRSARDLSARLDTRGRGVPVTVFNPSSWSRTGYVDVGLTDALRGLTGPLIATDERGKARPAVVRGDTLHFLASAVPSLGAAVFWIRPGRAPEDRSFAGSRTHLENEFISVDVDPATGQITRLYDKKARHTAVAEGERANVLQLLVDEPAQWDAWNTGFTGKQWTIDSVKSLRAGGDAVERWIEVEKPWNGTHITQRVILRRGEPFVEIDNRVDWHERHKFLKVAFNWNVTADSATYEIGYGAIGQPTNPATQAERAKYEHPGHRWGDLSDSSFGVSVLNDSKYGWDTRGHTQRLSLLRSPLWPDSLADRGTQHFRYAIYPHGGDWRKGLTERAGQAFNIPMIAVATTTHAGAAGRSWSVAGSSEPDVYITSVKRAEDAPGLVLRVVEWHGQATTTKISFGRAVRRVRRANLLEDPGAALPLAPDGRSVSLTLRPWEIATLLVE